MKENSIEEAKRIIEKLISTMKSDREMFDEKTREKEIYTFFINALEFILSDYKRVLKENEVLKNQEATQKKINELLVQKYSNSISKQKVKDKIEEIQEDKNNKYYDMFLVYRDLEYTIKILQELIEGRK